MIKSKHSGWTWDLRRTPFGGGGGVIDSVGNAIGSVVQSIGSGLASVDKAVNQVPGGWITVGGLAAGGAALAYAPEVMAAAAAEGVAPEVAATELGIPAVEVPAEAGGTAALNAGAPAVGAASPSGIAATQSAIGLGSAPTGLATSSVGMGGTVGAGSLAGIAGSEAAAGLGSLGTGLTAEQLAAYEAANPNMSTSDIIKNANRVKSVINSLNSSGKSSNPQALASALQATQTPMEQFGGLYNMNQHPYLSNQQTASLSPDSYNVSGQNIASPTAPTNQLLANLLYPKA